MGYIPSFLAGKGYILSSCQQTNKFSCLFLHTTSHFFLESTLKLNFTGGISANLRFCFSSLNTFLNGLVSTQYHLKTVPASFLEKKKSVSSEWIIPPLQFFLSISQHEYCVLVLAMCCFLRILIGWRFHCTNSWFSLTHSSVHIDR